MLRLSNTRKTRELSQFSDIFHGATVSSIAISLHFSDNKTTSTNQQNNLPAVRNGHGRHPVGRHYGIYNTIPLPTTNNQPPPAA